MKIESIQKAFLAEVKKEFKLNKETNMKGWEELYTCITTHPSAFYAGNPYFIIKYQGDNEQFADQADPETKMKDRIIQPLYMRYEKAWPKDKWMERHTMDLDKAIEILEQHLENQEKPNELLVKLDNAIYPSGFLKAQSFVSKLKLVKKITKAKTFTFRMRQDWPAPFHLTFECDNISVLMVCAKNEKCKDGTYLNNNFFNLSKLLEEK